MVAAVPRVLVIDDEETIRNLLRTTLQRYGYNVIDTENAQDGLKVLNEGRCDLVMVDILMPEMNGHAFMHAANQLPNRPPVIMMSGQAAVDDVIEGMHAGIDDFLTKPFSPRELAKTVGQVLERKRQHTAAVADTSRLVAALDLPSAGGATPLIHTQPGESVASEAKSGLIERIRVELAAGRITLPLPEPLAIHLGARLAESDLEARELVTLLEKSPQAAARVLHLARAPFYSAKGREVDSLIEAVLRIGTRTTANAARTVFAHEALMIKEGPFAQTATKLWENAVATAVLARLLSYRAKVVPPETAYLIALFHNLGELLILRLGTELGALSPGSFSAEDLLDDIVTHHAELGYALCKAWQLDDLTCTVAKRHHEPEVYARDTTDHYLRSVCSLVVLAHFMATELNGAPIPGIPKVPTRKQCEDILRISRSVQGVLVSECKEVIASTRELFVLAPEPE